MKTPLLTALACLLALVAAPVVGVAAETPQEAANKQLVLDFYRDIEATMAAGKPGEMPKVDAKYIDPGYIQHRRFGRRGGGGSRCRSLGGGRGFRRAASRASWCCRDGRGGGRWDI